MSTPAVEVNQSYREELVYVKGLLAVKLPVYLEYSVAGGALSKCTCVHVMQLLTTNAFFPESVG